MSSHHLYNLEGLMMRVVNSLCLVTAVAFFLSVCVGPAAAEPFVAKNGQAQATIVVGQQATAFDRWVAGELQRYLKQLSGAELQVVCSDTLPADQSALIVVGSPATNALLAASQEKGQVDFKGLKPEGLILKTVDLDGRPAVLVGGNDETGTMYAAYELLERLGIVFQLTNDIIPQKKPDLALPTLDVRMEPVLKDRGMHCCHGIRWYMGLEDFRREIDQLAKLKMNTLHFYCSMGGPWVEFSYGGKVAEISYRKETGYCGWERCGGTAKSVKVGRECFPQDGYIGPPEFAKVQTQKDAYRTAREFLREVIRYAHQRKVKVWLAMAEMPYVPPSLFPSAAKKLGGYYCGVAIPYGDPAMLGIWEAATRSMIESYPEADRYWVVGSEYNMSVDDPQTQAIIREYSNLRPLLQEKSRSTPDLAMASIGTTDKLIRRIKARYPEAKLGAEIFFRPNQLAALDTVLPKDIPLMNMVNWNVAAATKIEGRDLIVCPRVTEDSNELNIQYKTRIFDRQETVTGVTRYRTTGVIGQLNKARGAEQSARYLAEGSWNPGIRSQSFYERYVRALYGPDAKETLLKAFSMLEEKDMAMDWRYKRGFRFGVCLHGNAMCYSLTSAPYKEEKPNLDRQKVEKDIQDAEATAKFRDDLAVHYRQVLELLQQARPKVLPGSREELDYVIFKTKNFVTLLEGFSAVEQTKAAFGRALLAMNAGDKDGERKQLEATKTGMDRVEQLAREAAEQMIPYANDPTEKHNLWLFNDAMTSHEKARDYLTKVVAARKGFGQ
jgi:hypothetical protein